MKKFCHHKILANSKSPPSPTPIVMGEDQKPCKIKLLSYLVRNNMEPYYSSTWLSFINEKNEKKKKN